MKGFFFSVGNIFSRHFLRRIFFPRYFFLKSPIPLLKSQTVDPLGRSTSRSCIGRQRNVTKSMIHFQGCGFAHRTFFLFWLSRCRRLCGCLSCLCPKTSKEEKKRTYSSYRLMFSAIALFPPSVKSLHLLRNLFNSRTF